MMIVMDSRMMRIRELQANLPGMLMMMEIHMVIQLQYSWHVINHQAMWPMGMTAMTSILEFIQWQWRYVMTPMMTATAWWMKGFKRLITRIQIRMGMETLPIPYSHAQHRQDM